MQYFLCLKPSCPNINIYISDQIKEKCSYQYCFFHVIIVVMDTIRKISKIKYYLAFLLSNKREHKQIYQSSVLLTQYLKKHQANRRTTAAGTHRGIIERTKGFVLD